MLQYHSLEHIDLNSLMDESEHIEFRDDIEDADAELSESADLARFLTQEHNNDVADGEEEEVPSHNPFAVAVAPGPIVNQLSTIETPVPIEIDPIRRRTSTTLTASTDSMPATPSSPISGSDF